MKKYLALAAAAITLAVAAPASAAQWQNINARQATLDHRIDVGVRSGRLTPFEARNLRQEFRCIAFLESRYRRNGLSFGERRDLDARFDRLSFEIQAQMNDRDHRRHR